MPKPIHPSPLDCQMIRPLLFLGMISLCHISFSLEIQGVTLNASRELVNVGRNFVIRCNVTGGPDDLSITWLKAGKVIGLSHRTKVEGKVRRSRLSVRDVMAEDEGAYICQAKYAKRSLQNQRQLVFHPISKHFKFRQSTSLRTHCNFNFSSKVLGTSQTDNIENRKRRETQSLSCYLF